MMPKKFLVVDADGKLLAATDENGDALADVTAFKAQTPVFLARVISEHGVPAPSSPIALAVAKRAADVEAASEAAPAKKAKVAAPAKKAKAKK